MPIEVAHILKLGKILTNKKDTETHKHIFEYSNGQELLMTIPKVALANFVNVAIAMIKNEMNVNIVDHIPVVLLQIVFG